MRADPTPRGDCPTDGPPCGLCDRCATTEVAEAKVHAAAKAAYDGLIQGRRERHDG
jgi:hypothetical protein